MSWLIWWFATFEDDVKARQRARPRATRARGMTKLDSAARAMGLDAQIEHDDRYDLADEYLQVVYALWEGGWADDAVTRDRSRAPTPIRDGCVRCTTTASSSMSTPSRCGNHRRSAHPCCTRPALQIVAAYSPPATPSAYSSMLAPNKMSAASSPTCALVPRRVQCWCSSERAW